jgi:DNA-binding response OmpR family regulator
MMAWTSQNDTKATSSPAAGVTVPSTAVLAASTARRRGAALIAGVQADEYLEKPLRVDRLVAMATALIGRGRRPLKDKSGHDNLRTWRSRQAAATGAASTAAASTG